MDTSCHQASGQCHPESRGPNPASLALLLQDLVGIRSVYMVLNEEEVMRLCCVNLCRAYRMLQLPTVYLLDVNHEHTHVQYECRYSHV